mgnify:FL=1
MRREGEGGTNFDGVEHPGSDVQTRGFALFRCGGQFLGRDVRRGEPAEVLLIPAIAPFVVVERVVVPQAARASIPVEAGQKNVDALERDKIRLHRTADGVDLPLLPAEVARAERLALVEVEGDAGLTDDDGPFADGAVASINDVADLQSVAARAASVTTSAGEDESELLFEAFATKVL